MHALHANLPVSALLQPHPEVQISDAMRSSLLHPSPRRALARAVCGSRTLYTPTIMSSRIQKVEESFFQEVDRVVIDVPATSANLGPGFDSFGVRALSCCTFPTRGPLLRPTRQPLSPLRPCARAHPLPRLTNPHPVPSRPSRLQASL